MRTYRYHPWSIRKILRQSLKTYLFIAGYPILGTLLTFLLLGLVKLQSEGNPVVIYLSLAFIPISCVVMSGLLMLEWLDLRFTYFNLTDDSITRVQYGRISRSIFRKKVTEIRQDNGEMWLITPGSYLKIPDGLVEEDGVSCDIRAKLLKWMP